MLKKFSFYIKTNRIGFIIIATTLVLDIFAFIYYALTMSKYNMEYYQGSDYIEPVTASFIAQIITLLNLLAIVTTIAVFLFNTLSIFANNRKFRHVFESLSTVYYVINPILIGIATVLSFFYLQFAFIYEWGGYTSEFLLTYCYLFLVTTSLYFLALVVYKKINHYQMKYYDLKRKSIFIAVSILAIVMVMLTFFYALDYLFYNDITSLVTNYANNYSIQMTDKFYLMDNLLFDPSFVDLAAITGLLIISLLAVYSNICLDKASKPHVLNKVVIVALSVIMLTLVATKAITTDNVKEEVFSNKPNISKMFEVNVMYDDISDASFKDITKDIDNFTKREGISDYELSYGILSGPDATISFMSFIEGGENPHTQAAVGTRTYELGALEDYTIILGREPKDATEVIITDEFAANILRREKYESTDEIIGKKINEQEVVGIMETTDVTKGYDHVNSYSPMYYSMFDFEYPIYTYKKFDEKSFNHFLQLSQEVDNSEDELFTNNISVVDTSSSSLFLTLYVEVLDDDFTKELIGYNTGIFEDDIEIESSSNSTITTFNYGAYEDEMGQSSQAILVPQVLATVIFATSLLYLTSDPKRGGEKNV